MRVDLQSGYILHTRPFRDTSIIIDFFSESYGRLSILAKGVRSSKLKKRQYLQPFTGLIVSWQGKSNLKTLTHSEQKNLPLLLSGNYLYSGLYFNELLVRLLPEEDSQTEIYELYVASLNKLAQQQSLELTLRRFEFALLDSLGYGINFYSESETGLPIEPETYYCFVAGSGFVKESTLNVGSNTYTFYGAHILSMATDDFSDIQVLKSAKYLARMALQPILGHKPLRSREFFQPLNKPIAIAVEPLND